MAQPQKLTFPGTATPSIGGCKGLRSEIEHCQKLGIKVLLSIGGGTSTYTLTSKEEARELATSPQCPYPDARIGATLETGLFDYIWVQFYNNPVCEYIAANADNFFKALNKWASIKADKVFLGLPAAPHGAANNGYVEPEVLKSK
ncbi:hypothetical protein Ancab_031406, partial [Ancistrocladus abbreviatus]